MASCEAQLAVSRSHQRGEYLPATPHTAPAAPSTSAHTAHAAHAAHVTHSAHAAATHAAAHAEHTWVHYLKRFRKYLCLVFLW